MTRIDFIKKGLLMNLHSTPPIVSSLFKTTWNMTTDSFTLLTQPGTYNCTIDWGDGTTPTQHTTGNPTHTYATAGQYQISISGKYNGIHMDNDVKTWMGIKLLSIDDWGDVGFTSYAQAYRGCTNLISIPNTPMPYVAGTSFDSCFESTKLTTVPKDLFINNAHVLDFQYCFHDTSLTSISADLFRYNINATNFQGCFLGSSLAAIPKDLFKYNCKVTNFLGCFYGNKNISLPETIFDPTALSTKRPDMTSCFEVASTAGSPTGTVQDIWSYIYISTNNRCFKNCTALTNYASIPTRWK